MNELLIREINKELKTNLTEENIKELNEKKAKLRRDEKNINPHKLFESFLESFCSMKSD